MKIKFFNYNSKILIGIACLCVLLFTSCKKYFDVTPNSIPLAEVFDNVQDAQSAVWGVYQELAGDYGYGLNLSLYYPYDNDIMMGPQGNGDASKKDLTHYTINSGTAATVLQYPFNQLYEGIERANNCIKYIPGIAGFNDPNSSNQAQLHRLYGEVLTLRAQFYFDLVKIWGDVPAQYVPSADATNFFAPKTDRDSIYDHILNDLQIAENMMPWYWQVGSLDGRLTQNAARGLRARIALFRGGYSLRQSGQLIRGSNWQFYYNIAKTECDTIIMLGQNSLNTSYQAIFQNGLCIGKNEPKEVLFQIGASPGYGVNGDSKLGIYDGPKATTTGASAVTTGTTTGSSGVLILPNYFYMFDSTDTRRDVTCAPFSVGIGNVLTATKLSAIATGKFRRSWVSGGALASGQYLSENWPLIRYSDILLMDAEADNDLNGVPSANDINYLQMVQTRGHGNNASLDPVTPTDHDGFFNAIMNERALEFGGEGLRKYDLIRWDSLSAKITETKATLNNFLNGTGFFNGYDLSQLPTSMYWVNAPNGSIQWLNSFYAKTPSPAPAGTKSSWLGSGVQSFITYYAIGFITGKSELYPFHQAIITTNPNIVQNPGYQ